MSISSEETEQVSSIFSAGNGTVLDIEDIDFDTISEELQAREHATADAKHQPLAAAERVAAFAERPSGTAERKWGREVLSLGYCITPSLLLKAQRRLRLTPPQLMVLMHLMDIWWGDFGKLPWPSKQHLADRTGLSPRRLQSIMAELEEKKLLRRMERRYFHGGKTSNAYDLSGLVERLKELAVEFAAVERKVKKARERVASPGARFGREVGGDLV